MRYDPASYPPDSTDWTREGTAMKVLEAVAVGGTLVALSFGGAWAQDVKEDRGDIREDRRDIREDRRDIRQDTRDIRQDRRDLRQDRRELYQDRKAGDKDAVAQDRDRKSTRLNSSH